MYKVTSNNLKNEENRPFIYFFRKKLRKMFVVKKNVYLCSAIQK